MIKDLYRWHYSNYWPVSNERLEDQLANNELARAKVYLIFIVGKLYKATENEITILEAFVAPSTLVYSKP
jgi:hypothetical protein